MPTAGVNYSKGLGWWGIALPWILRLRLRMTAFEPAPGQTFEVHVRIGVLPTVSLYDIFGLVQGDCEEICSTWVY